MSYGKQTKRGREVMMTMVDEAAFTRVLKEAFPGIRFVDGQVWPRPGIPWIDTIDGGQETLVYGFLPDPGWQPKEKEQYRGRYSFALPRRSFQFDRSEWDWTLPRGANWAWDPPTLTVGSITSSYYRDDPEDKFFVNKLYRLLRKIMVNAFRVEFPHLGVVYGEATGYDYWAGHDALRWCSEAPARMLDGKFRPHSEWSFPEDNSYYQGLGIFGRPVKPTREDIDALPNVNATYVNFPR